MTTSTDAHSWDSRTDLAWITSLARRLAHPGEDADDLAQETWLVALQQPDRPKGSSRSWLAGVLRNLRRMRARTDRRRHDRERDVDAPDPTTPEAALEQLETLEVLRAALGELDPLDRRLVLGRYATGQSAVQLGELFGLPASTVRTRLQRARERLRDDVQSLRGVGCFAPWMLRPADAAIGATVAVVGGVAMSTATKIGIGIVVIAVLGIGVDRLAAAPQPADSAERADEAVTSVQPRARADAPGTIDSAKVESLRIKRERIRDRREQRTAARVATATAGEPEAIVTDSCDDGCIGTLAMQLALAKAMSGCRDDLPEEAHGKTKFRVRVIAEPGIGAVVDGVEVLENGVDADFAECVVQSAPLAELSDPENPIADDIVFRYTIGEPANPASEFIAAHPELVLGYPDLAALVSRPPGSMTDQEMTAFARWIDEDPGAQAAFGNWAAEEGIDLANVRVD
jgi:RNA polymerase sigma-70 factor (ECF subfamily)